MDSDINNKITCHICGFDGDGTILSHIRNIHHISTEEYKKIHNFPVRIPWANRFKNQEHFKKMGNASAKSMKGQKSRAALPEGKWSRKYDKCIQCHSTKSIHVSHGLCKNCFTGNDHKRETDSVNLELITNGGIENKNYIICQICGLPFKSLTTYGHLVRHKITLGEYKNKFPNYKTRSEDVTKKLSMAVSKGRKRLMAKRGYLNPPSQRLLKSKEMARRHALEEFATVSGIEQVVADWLGLNGYRVLWTKDILENMDLSKVVIRQYAFDCYCVDFAIPYDKIIIEVLGDWWHGWNVISGKEAIENQYPKVKSNLRTDIIRFAHIKKQGWKLIKIWEHNIDNGNFKNIIARHL